MSAPGHGGRRAGAGRKPDAERHAAEAARFADSCSKYLGKVFGFLSDLAEGGTRTQVTSVAAGTLLRRDVARDPDGSVIRDSKGRPSVAMVRSNDLPADQLMVVKQVVTTMPPDFRALELIVHHCTGTPRPSPEVAADILEIRTALLAATAAIAARKARPPQSDEPPPSPPLADDDDPE